MVTHQARTVSAALCLLVGFSAGCGGSLPAPSSRIQPGIITVSPSGIITGTLATFVSELARDSGGNPLTFAWNFGDGATGAGVTTTHVYPFDGGFTANVIVTNDIGNSATASKLVMVKSLTTQWFGDIEGLYPAIGGHGRATIVQQALNLTGTYEDDSHVGAIEGTISETGTITFTVAIPGMAPFTFTGKAGLDVNTLEGRATGPDFTDKSWALRRSVQR